MTLPIVARNAVSAAIAAGATWVSLHTADPGTTGASEAAGVARKQTTWGSPSNGDVAGSQVSFDIPGAAGPYSYMGIWTAASGGTFWGKGALSPAETFSAAGTLRVTPTIDG